MKERVGFKVVWTAVEALVGDPATSTDVIAIEKCDQFVCKGGHLCIDQGQGVCPSRTQLCIHSSLVCNGINNCVEGDYSDEQHCEFVSTYLRFFPPPPTVSVSFLG